MMVQYLLLLVAVVCQVASFVFAASFGYALDGDDGQDKKRSDYLKIMVIFAFVLQTAATCVVFIAGRQ